MAYDLTALKVLVVDDNPHMRTLIREMLHAFGIRNIKERPDGKAAFTALLNFEADVVIVDWKMENGDGLEFTRKVRTDEKSPNRFVPIVMLTGYSERERVIEARDAGVTEFMSKPVSATAIYNRFAAVIEHPRPFVQHKEYFGPDRRRSVKSFVNMDRRIEDPNAAIMDPDTPLDSDVGDESDAQKAAPEGDGAQDDPDATNDEGKADGGSEAGGQRQAAEDA